VVSTGVDPVTVPTFQSGTLSSHRVVLGCTDVEPSVGEPSQQ